MDGCDGEDYVGQATDDGSAHEYYEPQSNDASYETYDAQGLGERIESAVPGTVRDPSPRNRRPSGSGQASGAPALGYPPS